MQTVGHQPQVWATDMEGIALAGTNKHIDLNRWTEDTKWGHTHSSPTPWQRQRWLTRSIEAMWLRVSVDQWTMGRTSLRNELWPMTCSNLPKGPALIYGDQPTEPACCLHVRCGKSQMSIPMTTQGAKWFLLELRAPSAQHLIHTQLLLCVLTPVPIQDQLEKARYGPLTSPLGCSPVVSHLHSHTHSLCSGHSWIFPFAHCETCPLPCLPLVSDKC